MNKPLAIIFFLEWLVFSIFIGETLPNNLKLFWYAFITWMILGAIPLLVYAMGKEDKK